MPFCAKPQSEEEGCNNWACGSALNRIETYSTSWRSRRGNMRSTVNKVKLFAISRCSPQVLVKMMSMVHHWMKESENTWCTSRLIDCEHWMSPITFLVVECHIGNTDKTLLCWVWTWKVGVPWTELSGSLGGGNVVIVCLLFSFSASPPPPPKQQVLKVTNFL